MGKTRILVADDNDMMLGVITRLLGGTDTSILYASTGPMALDRAKREEPDLILLDIDMPGMNGYDVCSALRRDPRTRHIPIIMLTGRGEGADELYGLNIGADDYITKPFDLQCVKARTTALLRRNQVRVALNPLTMLPGNRAIRVAAEKRLSAGKQFVFTYVDIRRFKAFNDSWGFSWGDKVIKDLADLLCSVVEDLGCLDSFVGHIGGDDFVLMTDTPVDEEALRLRFEARVNAVCQDAEPGSGSSGVTLTFGQVDCGPNRFSTFDSLSHEATRVKGQNKAGI